MPNRFRGRVAQQLRCDTTTERAVESAMLRHCPDGLLEALTVREFDAFAWGVFAQYRRHRLAEGLDDPMWDLSVSCEVATEGAVS